MEILTFARINSIMIKTFINSLVIFLQTTKHITIKIDEQTGVTEASIDKVEKEDSAVFSVTAENSAGKASHSFSLVVIGKFISTDI